MRSTFAALLTLMIAAWALAPTATLAFSPFEQARIDQRPDAQLPLSTPFLDEWGRKVNLQSYAGKRPMLLIPLLHRCPNICGVTLAGLMEAIRAQSFQPETDFSVVAMSIDPAEKPVDAQASMEELRKRYPSLVDHIHALTGDAQAIAAVTEALGYRYAWDSDISQYAHIAATAVVTREGYLSRWLYGLSPAPDDLKLALTEAGRGEIGSWGDQLLLLCYHYDPTTGQYSPIIWEALRIGGGVTAATLLGWLAMAFVRERRRTEAQRNG